MCRLGYLSIFTALLLCFPCVVYGSENVTFEEVPVDTLVNLTGNNELWTILLKDCQKPTLTCVQNNVYKYLKLTLDETDDLQFTSFMKFTKNKLDYGRIQRSFDMDTNDTSEDHLYDDEFPIESISRALQDNAAKFFMTHDLELSLPDGLFPNSVLKVAPRGLENQGALVNIEIVSKDLEEAREMKENENGEHGMEQRTFKRIHQHDTCFTVTAASSAQLLQKIQGFEEKVEIDLNFTHVGIAVDPISYEHVFFTVNFYCKFINEKLIYALLAILLVVKLLAIKFLFLLPLLVGAATAKKLLLKILLFVFPFLHHIFKFCAYYPVQAKYHHHKHLISHIHEIAPHKHHDHHHEGIEVVGPHGYGPPHEEHYQEYDDDVSVFPDDGSGFPHGLISHRKDPHLDNEISAYSQVQPTRRKPGRPLTSREVERMIAKAEKEAIIKARLQKERIRIREENLRLQEQLNQAIKLQEKLKQHSVYLNKKLPPTKITSSVPYSNRPAVPPLKGSPFDDIASATFSDGPGIELPAGYIPQHTVPQRPANSQPVHQNQFDPKYQNVPQNHFEQQYQASIQNNFKQQYQPNQISTQQQASQSAPSLGPIYKPELTSTQLVNSNRKQLTSSEEFDIQKSVELDPRRGVFDNSKEVQDVGNEFVKYSNTQPIGTVEKSKPVEMPASAPKPKLEQDIYQAASITYDKFYSPILQKIDKILQPLGFNDESCKERLICSMYKNPTKFSPYSNLLSAELSRDSSELQKPAATNSAVVRFYKYVQAARDGQDQRDCLRLYTACLINTEVS